jgi:membrane associated rhomboid family serine protease
MLEPNMDEQPLNQNNINNNNIQNPLPQILNNNNNNNLNNQTRLIINKDFFMPFFSLGSSFGIYNDYYSIYKNNPRKKSLFYFFQSFFFPNLTLHQITFYISIINISIYIITLFFGIEKTSKEDLLTIKHSTLNNFGSFKPNIIKENKLNFIRAFTANLLHLNLKHLIFNTMTLYIFPSLFEIFIKKYEYLIIYFLSGFFSYVDIGNNNNKTNFYVGPNPAIFSIIGALLSYLIFNWHELNRSFGFLGKIYLIYFIIIYFIIYSLFFINNSFMDPVIHSCGFTFGFLIFSAYNKPINNTKIKIFFRLMIFFLLCLILYGDFYSYFK